MAYYHLKMLTVLLSAAVILGCAPAAAPPKPKAPVATAVPLELQKAWEVVAIEAGGQTVPADRVQKIKLGYSFIGDKLTITRADNPASVHKVFVDNTVKPARIRIEGPSPILGVYELNGNTLKICVMTDEKESDYPASVASAAAPKTDVLTMVDAMAAEPAPPVQPTTP